MLPHGQWESRIIVAACIMARDVRVTMSMTMQLYEEAQAVGSVVRKATLGILRGSVDAGESKHESQTPTPTETEDTATKSDNPIQDIRNELVRHVQRDPKLAEQWMKSRTPVERPILLLSPKHLVQTLFPTVSSTGRRGHMLFVSKGQGEFGRHVLRRETLLPSSSICRGVILSICFQFQSKGDAQYLELRA